MKKSRVTMRARESHFLYERVRNQLWGRALI